MFDCAFALLQFLDQQVNPLDGEGVETAAGKPAIAADFGIDRIAPLAHGTHRCGSGVSITHSQSSIEAGGGSMMTTTIIVTSGSGQSLFFAAGCALQQSDEPRTAPKFNIVSINHALGLGNGFVVVGAN
jgi:hypothetical protein